MHPQPDLAACLYLGGKPRNYSCFSLGIGVTAATLANSLLFLQVFLGLSFPKLTVDFLPWPFKWLKVINTPRLTQISANWQFFKMALINNQVKNSFGNTVKSPLLSHFLFHFGEFQPCAPEVPSSGFSGNAIPILGQILGSTSKLL